MIDKQKLIDKTIDALNKEYGKDGVNAAQTLTEAFTPEKVKGFIPTGNLAIDWVIGKPGFPCGRVTEIAGKPGSGKSSIMAATIGAAQAADYIAVLVDAEHSYDSSWARIHNVKPEELIYLDPPHLEGVFDETGYAIKQIKATNSDIPIVIIIDSVSAEPTASELERDDSTASQQAAEHAKIISAGLRKISKLIWNENVALIFVSQLKDNPRAAAWQDSKSKIGGNAIWFHAGLMLEVARTAYKVSEEKHRIGQTIQIKSVKNKFILDPHRVHTFDLFYGEGFRRKEILIDFLTRDEVGIVTQKGGWLEFEGSKFRKEDLALKLEDSLFQDIYKKLGICA